MATIRELFHTLGNKHNLLTVGCGVTKEIVEECLEENVPQAVKKKLSQVQKNLKTIIEDAKEADKIAADIHDEVYATIDPDTGKIK